MKRMFELFATAVVLSVGVEFGTWLWEEAIENKVTDLKQRIKERH